MMFSLEKEEDFGFDLVADCFEGVGGEKFFPLCVVVGWGKCVLCWSCEGLKEDKILPYLCKE